MKKTSILFFVLISCAFSAAGASSLRNQVERTVSAICATSQDFDEAVKQRDFRRIENTLLHTQNQSSLRKWLRRGVKVQGRTVSVPEYFVATAKKGETDGLKKLLSVYGAFYEGDKKGFADNLLEKLSGRRHIDRKMELVQMIFSSFGLERVSNRTFLYIVSEATDESGYHFARFVADKKGASIYTGRRDAENYPMPYVLSGTEDVCVVLSNRLSGTLTDAQWTWLKKTKELFCTSRP